MKIHRISEPRCTYCIVKVGQLKHIEKREKVDRITPETSVFRPTTLVFIIGRQPTYLSHNE